MKGRDKECHFKGQKENNCQAKILYQEKRAFKLSCFLSEKKNNLIKCISNSFSLKTFLEMYFSKKK